MQKFFLHIITLILSCGLITTTLSAQNNDCIRATKLCFLSAQNFASGTTAGSGDPGLTLGCLGGKNAASWYYFTVSTGGTLTFTIDPANNTTDYDWALYKSPTNNSNPATACDGSNELGAPVRCNFSATAGNTGLATTAANNSEGASGTPFSKSVTVVAGEVYYLLIDNYSKDGYPFTFYAASGNTATLNCTGVVGATSPCACATPTCASLLSTTYQAAQSENNTITAGNDCTNFNPPVPVDTDGDSQYEFCSSKTLTAGNYGLYSGGEFKLVSGGACAGSIVSKTISSACGTPIASVGTGSNGQPYWTLAAGTYKICHTVRLLGPDCLQFNSSCLNLYNAPVPPANDAVCNAITVACASSTAGTTTNAAATGEPTASCGTTPDAPGVWYKFVAVANQSVTISTNNGITNYDTRLNVYTATGACASFAYTCIGGNDDAGGGNKSTYTFSATAGTTYYILANGYSGATGNFQLDVSCTSAPANDACTGAFPLACGASYTAQVNASATSTNDPTAACSGYTPGNGTLANIRGMWYSMVGSGKDINLTLTNTTMDGQIFVYSGTSCNVLTCVKSADVSGGGGTETLTFYGQSGINYYIMISGYSATTGSFSLSATCTDRAYNVGGTTTGGGVALCATGGTYLSPDTDCVGYYQGINSTDNSPTGGNSSPMMIYDQTGILRDPGGTSNYSVVAQLDCDDLVFSSNGQSWYGPTAICPNGADGGSMTLTFSSFNLATGDAVIVYNGPTSNYPEVTGSPFTGTTLPAAITSSNAQGCLTFEFYENNGGVSSGFQAAWTSTGNTGRTLVPNDDCANATVVPFECGKFSGSTINTTASCNDPYPTNFGDESGFIDDITNTSWFKFSVPAGMGGATTVRLTNIDCPTSFNATTSPSNRGLKGGIFDGMATGLCPTLATVAAAKYNPVSPFNPTSFNFPSLTTTSGNTYFIGIAGYLGSQCDFDIEVDRFTNLTADVFTGSQALNLGSCAGPTTSTGYYRCNATNAISDAFIAVDVLNGRGAANFVPVMTINASSTLAACHSLAITNGIRYIYRLADGNQWVFTINDGLCPMVLSGEYKALENCDICGTYTKKNINVNATYDYETTFCAGTQATVNFVATVDAAKTVPSIVTANPIGGRKLGLGLLATAPENYVADYKKYIQYITTPAITAAVIGNTNADAKINALSFSMTAKWQDMVIVLKNSSCPAKSAQLWKGISQASGGDNTLTPSSMQLSYSSVTGQFTAVTNVTSYTTPSVTTGSLNATFAGCDPEKFYLEVNDNNASVLQYSINAFDMSFVDKATPTAVTSFSTLAGISWTGSSSASGGISGIHTDIAQLGFSTNYSTATFTSPTCPTDGGNCVYSYTIRALSAGDLCPIDGTANVVIKSLPSAAPTANFATVNCTNPTATLSANTPSASDATAPTYAWSGGPATLTKIVTPIGPTGTTTYTVAVTRSNGCTASNTVTVTADKVIPIAALSTPGLICQGSLLPLSTASSITLGAATYAWTTPDGATITGANPIRTNAQPSMSGIYTVTVTDINGCTAESAEGVTVDNSTGVVELAVTSTNATVLHKNCDDGQWTYYSDPANHTKLLFGIEWAPDGSIHSNNQAAKDMAEIKIEVRPAGIYNETAIAGLGSEGTWTMKRWWEVHMPASYTITEPVNIRFFYSAAEKTDIQTAAATFQNTNCTNAYPNGPTGGKCGYEGFEWFKIDGLYSNTNIGTATTPSAVMQATLLTNTNASTASTINSVLYAQFEGLTSFSTGTGVTGVGPAASPLPVKLLNFSGKINGDTNDLTWTTASELNTAFHILETSVDGLTDWKLVATQRGAGTSDIRQEYKKTDAKPFRRAFYRLRFVDFDGSFEYSNIVLLERTKTNFGFVSAYPVPTNGIVKVDYQVEEAQSLTFRVLDVLGRVLDVQTTTAAEGVNSTTFDLSDYANAIYIITMENGTRKTVFKVVKTN